MLEEKTQELMINMQAVLPLIVTNALSALALWYRARTADSRVGTRKTMIVALARKLVIALWRFVTTGETLEGVVLRPAG